MEFVIFLFGVPRIIVTDNNTHFIGEIFTNTLSQLKIKHIKAYVAYPQANKWVGVSNWIILQGLKKLIKETHQCWVDELPNMLWSYRTTPRSVTGTSPFRMAYSVEAVSPVEISLTSSRIEFFNLEGSESGLKLNNDLIEEVRDEVVARTLLQQLKTPAYFNKKVKTRHFLVGDLVLREAASSQPKVTGKFKPS